MQNLVLLSEDELKRVIAEGLNSTIEKKIEDAFIKATSKEWYTSKEVTELLQISRRSLQHLRDTEQIGYTQNGKTIRYHRSDIDAYIKKGKVRGRYADAR